jgi:DNA-binding transcriptional regulator YiaG
MNMNECVYTGVQVELARKSLALTQELFGKKLSLSARVVSNIEIGVRQLKPSEAKK